MRGPSASWGRAVGAVAGALGVLPAAWTTYLAVLSVAALRRPPAPHEAPEVGRLVVLVPAHDEQELLGRCLDSLTAQDLPASAYRLVVVADNCTDRTAEVALAHGAEVLVRTAEGDLRAPQVGRMSMDQIVVDLGPDSAARAGDEVVLFGAGAPSAEDWARAAGTIPYEVLTSVSGRVAREVLP